VEVRGIDKVYYCGTGQRESGFGCVCEGKKELVWTVDEIESVIRKE